MGRIFGTDGIRGVANGDLTAEFAMKIGRAAAMVVEESIGRRPTFLVGKDTRISSDMLEAAISAGLCCAGADVVHLGVVPTPAVALLVTKYGADAGVMLSASHNPYEYNGIKLFNASGYKLLDSREEEIERIILDGEAPCLPKGPADIGRISYNEEDAVHDYAEYIKATAPEGLGGLRVALDCANGSASATAEKIFRGLGAECAIFHAAPDGLNVNAGCGSTHVEEISRIVREGRFDAGLTFDGDADRCQAVDERGELLDGDRLLALFAYHMKRQGKLKNNTLVATVMSNLGLFKFAERQGIDVRATRVGDRYVLEEMLRDDFVLGGEQSGHIIFRDYMTTGDGQLSGVQLLSLVKAAGRPLSELAGVMRGYPQTLLNVRATPEMKAALTGDERVLREIEGWNERLGGEGRVLVRASGTEPLIRIMVEGREQARIEEIARCIAQVIEG